MKSLLECTIDQLINENNFKEDDINITFKLGDFIHVTNKKYPTELIFKYDIVGEIIKDLMMIEYAGQS
tara:strand:+ start:781 stop:984 length:204 start_codon:yes stop_codon:yes gene_type:complete